MVGQVHAWLMVTTLLTTLAFALTRVLERNRYLFPTLQLTFQPFQNYNTHFQLNCYNTENKTLRRALNFDRTRYKHF